MSIWLCVVASLILIFIKKAFSLSLSLSLPSHLLSSIHVAPFVYKEHTLIHPHMHTRTTHTFNETGFDPQKWTQHIAFIFSWKTCCLPVLPGLSPSLPSPCFEVKGRHQLGSSVPWDATFSGDWVSRPRISYKFPKLPPLLPSQRPSPSLFPFNHP